MKHILILGGGYFLINIGTIFINRLKGVISVRTSQSMTTDMRTDVYTHLQKLGFDYYDSRPHGKILTRVINYVNNVSDFLTNGLINAVMALINLLIILSLPRFYLPFLGRKTSDYHRFAPFAPRSKPFLSAAYRRMKRKNRS